MSDRLPRDPRPAWSKEPFFRFLDYLRTERQLLGLAAAGINGLVHREKLVEALYDVDNELGTANKEAEARLSEARATAKVARAEVEADFPLLHAHSLISIWGALEALVHDVMREWIRHRPALLKREAFAGVKVGLAEFHRMKLADRIDYLLDAVQPQGSGGGFRKFEALLAKIDLGGPVEEGVRRSLLESWEVRNLYAHRRGLVDKKARDACPWRKRDWRLGEQVLVSHEDYERYAQAIHDYAYELIVRSGAKFGLDVRAYAQEANRLVEAGKYEYDETGRVLRPTKRRRTRRTDR